MKNWYYFYKYSILLGIRFFLKGNFKFSKEALKRIIIPMDIARYFEIPATFRYLDAKANEKILDISSPKLISFYISEKIKSVVYGTDVWNKEIIEWKKIKSNVIFNRNLTRNLKLNTVDGRKLPYKKNFFDKIFSVSVIEHIEKNGDTACIRELARVLKPGGKIVITTPFGSEYKENWVSRDAYGNKFDGDKPVFLSRIYDKKNLKTRLIDPSGLKLESRIICNERFPIITTIYTHTLPLSPLFGLIFPLLAKLTLHEGQYVGDKNNILIVLRKDADKA